MNEVKRLGVRGRIRAAWRAFIGKPAGHLNYGLEIKRCDKCERGDCGQCVYKEHSRIISKLPHCLDCARRKSCEYEPEWGEWQRINCPHHVPEEV